MKETEKEKKTSNASDSGWVLMHGSINPPVNYAENEGLANDALSNDCQESTPVSKPQPYMVMGSVYIPETTDFKSSYR